MALLPSIPRITSAGASTPRVRKAQFGDGYEQRTADGINHIVKQWSVEFTLELTEANTLVDFFDGLGGVSNFQWLPPSETEALNFVCDTWNYQLMAKNVMHITATFQQVYEA